MSKMANCRNLLVITSFAAIAFANSATAQTVPAAAESGAEKTAADAPILVTGSRIARRTLENASPIQILDSKQLDARGYETIGQALNELPTFGVPGASPVGFNQSNLGAGQSFVNFLGLGSQRTLTLVNGRRFVSSNTASIFGPTGAGGSQVDLNVIPTKLIDRVETVTSPSQVNMTSRKAFCFRLGRIQQSTTDLTRPPVASVLSRFTTTCASLRSTRLVLFPLVERCSGWISRSARNSLV